jgi:hypothetical protein
VDCSSPIRSHDLTTPHHFFSSSCEAAAAPPPLTVSSPNTFDAAMNLIVYSQQPRTATPRDLTRLTSHQRIHPVPASPLLEQQSCATNSPNRTCWPSTAPIGRANGRFDATWTRRWGRWIVDSSCSHLACGRWSWTWCEAVKRLISLQANAKICGKMCLGASSQKMSDCHMRSASHAVGAASPKLRRWESLPRTLASLNGRRQEKDDISIPAIHSHLIIE